MNAAKYLLDANVFIESAKNYYSFDIVPKFWETIETEHKDEKVFSLQCVKNEILRGRDELSKKDEILRGKDELSKWVENLPSSFFLPGGEAVEDYGEIQRWARRQEQYKESAMKEFARYENADPWLVAFALKYGYRLVTMEKLNLEKKNNIPIPNVCREFEIEYITTFDMLRELKVSF